MEYLALILLFLPAAWSNSVPAIAAHVPFLKKYNTPIDLGKSWKGHRIFGDHKTIRGLVLGTFGSGLLALVIFALPLLSKIINTELGVEFSLIQAFSFGLLTGFSSLVGDSFKSFFKRRVGIKSGESWFPFDQIDYIVGGLIVVPLMVNLELSQYVFIAVFSFFLHLGGTILGYFIGVKDSWI